VNGLTVLALAFLTGAVLFVTIVKIDRWLDRRERDAMYAEAARYQRAVNRLAEIHARDAGRTRIGHHDHTGNPHD
jgi:hypothetical protein